MYTLTNWAENIKDNHFIKLIDSKSLTAIIGLLDKEKTFWFVIVKGGTTTSKQFVYSCKPNAIQRLSSITSTDFFIVDKKLAWLSYFQRNKNRIGIYRSRETTAPFK